VPLPDEPFERLIKASFVLALCKEKYENNGTDHDLLTVDHCRIFEPETSEPVTFR
jgi:hypothetical protein